MGSVMFTMVSVGLGRASRGLTAIPVQAAGGPEPRAKRSGPAQAPGG
ncbi:MAG: hypothetical protein ACT6RN_25440 [Agrobacterium sp.]